MKTQTQAHPRWWLAIALFVNCLCLYPHKVLGAPQKAQQEEKKADTQKQRGKKPHQNTDVSSGEVVESQTAQPRIATNSPDLSDWEDLGTPTKQPQVTAQAPQPFAAKQSSNLSDWDIV